LRLLFERIRLAWLKFPELRLGQLICNALLPASGSETAPLFHVDDNALVATLEAYVARQMQPKSEAPPVADSSDAVREIKFGSTWKQAIPPGVHVRVVSVVGGVQYQWRGEKGYDDVSEAEFRMHFVHVSDPQRLLKETP
jgi:hypothetical protein